MAMSRVFPTFYKGAERCSHRIDRSFIIDHSSEPLLRTVLPNGATDGKPFNKGEWRRNGKAVEQLRRGCGKAEQQDSAAFGIVRLNGSLDIHPGFGIAGR